MGGLGRVEKQPQKRKREENRTLTCELCGSVLEPDQESNEYRCPLCDLPEE